MIEFQLPWVFALLPLPLLVFWLMPERSKSRGPALRIPFYSRFTALRDGSGTATARSVLIAATKIAIWCLLVTAVAQPTWIGPARSVETRGRDLMFALDLSGSMETPDFEVNGRAIDRLSVVRAVAQDFIRHREGDRVGLVLFGSRAYLQSPLTLDRESVIEMLDEAELGLAGQETAIGDAIGIAVKHLRNRPAEERVLVLLSDGENNSGVLGPEEAAELAASNGVRVYTIGIGTGAQLVQSVFGTRMMAPGDGVDETALREIADRTGGLYFRARDTESLVRAHQQIDTLEPTAGKAQSVRPMRALFHLPLALALSVVLGLIGLAIVREWLSERGGVPAGVPAEAEPAAQAAPERRLIGFGATANRSAGSGDFAEPIAFFERRLS